MELKRALELHTEYAGSAGIIRVDADDYICLNELNAFFPNKRVDHWLANDATKEFIALIEKTIIPGKSGIIAKRGKRGGTWAHHLIAFEFAMWLSAEFKLKVYQEYIEGRQNKQDWNIKRILAASNYKFMCDSVKADHDPAKPYHFSNEARMLNTIVFGEPSFDRDQATEDQLDAIAWLEGRNGALIDYGLDYSERKSSLTKMYREKYLSKVGRIESASSASE
jgi:hypothetical protein